METTTLLILRRLFILAILFLLSIVVLTAQIKIKERVEIAPKIKISGKVNSDSPTNTIPLLYGNSGFVCTTHPCLIQASGYIDYAWSGVDGRSYAVLYIEGEGWKNDWATHIIYEIWGTSIYNTPLSFEVGGWFHVSPRAYCPAVVAPEALPGELKSDNATAVFGTPGEMTATVIAIPVPAYELDTIAMTTYQTSLDAYGSHEAFITATILNGSGDPFNTDGFYEKPPWMKFTIENPSDGMYLRRMDGVEGTSIECYFLASECNFYFVWNGGDIQHEIDTVSISGEYLNASGTLKIQLKKIVPHHFTVTPELDTIYAGESDAITAIAKNINDEEVHLDGGKSITFLDESGAGSFIIGSDTIPTQITVTYDQAKNGSVKYYCKPGTSNLADEQYVWIDAFRTEYHERIGYGLIDVMPACPVVSLSEKILSPSNKTTVSVMAKTENGVFPYPSDQIFIASMDADAKYGKLRCISTNEEGSSISGTQPFEFIAADSIDVDSIVVNITVSPTSNGGGGGGGGGVGSIKDGQKKDTLNRHAGLMLEKETKAVEKRIVTNKDGTKNVLVLPQEAITKKLTEQNNVLAQKIAKKQASINAITEAIKTKKAGKDNAVSAKQLNAMIQDLAEGSSCNESATLTIEKEDCGNPPCGDPPTVNLLPPRDVSNLAPPPKEVCQDPNELGWTTPRVGGDNDLFLNNTLNNLFSVQVCANRFTKPKQWEFRLTSVGFLYQTGICESHLTGKTDIGDGMGLNVNAANYCAILKWLKKINPTTNQPYPDIYYSRNIIQLHEGYHVEKLYELFRNQYLQAFRNLFNSLNKPITDCSEFAQSVIDRNKNMLEEEFDKLTEVFVKTEIDNEESDVQKATKIYFKGLKENIEKRAVDEKWPKCQ